MANVVGPVGTSVVLSDVRNQGVRVITKQELNRQEAIQFIRGQTIVLNLVGGRPNTNMKVFFGDIDVTSSCYPFGTDPQLKLPLTTNFVGEIIICLVIEPNTFNTGTHSVTVTDSPNRELLNLPGSTYGTSIGTFTAEGTLNFYKNTETSIITVYQEVIRQEPIRCDPLAQSFFTYGVKGGMFISSIDVYFATKDSVLPVRMEVRPMVNGYPSKFDAATMNFVSMKNAADISVSTNASVPTKFKFEPPIYVAEDSDYCFVLRTNSNDYQVFTSRMGENSIEDGKKIYEQPYVGSLFKSENNITWTAEQFEDIKFTINKAKFSLNENSTVVFSADLPAVAAYGNQFKTVAGSNVITYTHPQEHGLFVDSKFRVYSSYAGIMNGIDATELHAAHNVTEIVDTKTLKFAVATAATSSGPMSSTGKVNYVGVNRGGSGYTANDTIAFSGGGGTGAAGTLVLNGGVIESVEITNAGTGYTTNPIVTINTLTGTNGSLYASVLPAFAIRTNKPYNAMVPAIAAEVFGDCEIEKTLYPTATNFEGGNIVPYTAGQSFEFRNLGALYDLKQYNMVASFDNQDAFMSFSNSCVFELRLKSTNENLSPIINLKQTPQMIAYNTLVNNQNDEDLSSTNKTGSVDSLVVTAAGSGYTVTPIVNIAPPDLLDGVQATATATLVGTYVSSITVVNAGSGYTKTPLVTITRGVGDNTGTGAAVKAVLTKFNSELLAHGGTAKARYLTKQTKLAIVSNGVRLFSTISSTQGSSVDFYIRTTLSTSGVQHELQSWKRFDCNVKRNKSSYIGEFFEYEFRLDNLPEFDTYDLKCVLTANNPTKSPIVQAYRMIALA